MESFGINHSLSILDLLRLSMRVFRTKPTRTLLTILGMSVGIGTVVILISLGYGLQYILIGKLVTTEDSLVTLGVTYPQDSNLNIDKAKLEELSGLPNVAEVSLVSEFPAEVRFASSTGLINTKITKPNYFRLSGTVPDIGREFKENESSVILSSQAVKILGLNPDVDVLNKEINLSIAYQEEQNGVMGSYVHTKNPLVIKGIITDDQPPYAIVPIDQVVQEPPFYKEVLLKGASIDVIEGMRDEIIAKGFVGVARLDLVNQAKKVMNIITSILGVFGVAALVVSAIGMFNTMIVGFMERIYEVGIMKSLGATDRDIKNLFLMESLMMGLLGGIGGVMIGAGGGKILNIGISLFSQHYGGKAFELFITPLWFVGVTIGLSAFIGIASGLGPAVNATKLSPKEAFKSK